MFSIQKLNKHSWGLSTMDVERVELKCGSCHKAREKLHECGRCHRNVCLDCLPHYTAVTDKCAECHSGKPMRFR